MRLRYSSHVCAELLCLSLSFPFFFLLSPASPVDPPRGLQSCLPPCPLPPDPRACAAGHHPDRRRAAAPTVHAGSGVSESLPIITCLPFLAASRATEPRAGQLALVRAIIPQAGRRRSRCVARWPGSSFARRESLFKIPALNFSCAVLRSAPAPHPAPSPIPHSLLPTHQSHSSVKLLRMDYKWQADFRGLFFTMWFLRLQCDRFKAGKCAPSR